MSIFDNDMFSSAIFYPRKVKRPEQLPAKVDILEFEIGEDIIIGALMFTYNPELPSILLFHGNGEIVTDYFNHYHYYITSGVNLCVVDYRGYGFSSSEPMFTDLFTDPPVIYELFRDWLKENEYRDDVIVMGRSLGSVCASELGMINPEGLLGIIFESAFSSTYHLMKKLFLLGMVNVKEEEIYPYSNEKRIKEIEKPVLIIHGKDDQLIPYSEAEAIYNNIKGEKKLVTIDKAGHNDISSFTNEYFNPLAEFIKSIS